jgi:cytochrome c-type biogenesis protein CcmH/NrfG
MQARSQQLLLVAGASALTIALYLSPQKVSREKEQAPTQVTDFDAQLKSSKAGLQRQEADMILSIETKLEKESGNLSLLDSLGRRWDALQKPAIAAHYFEEHAARDNEESSWLNAAYRYFDAFKSTTDSLEKSLMVENAIRCYENVLKINPKNLDAKTDLGVCYAEGTSNPMQGIMMLREVVTENPAHENAQFNLGILSMRSGQYEKAAERFEKVLTINPARKEMYLLTGRAYMMAGNSAKASANFEKLKEESADAALVAQANNYINQLSNH